MQNITKGTNNVLIFTLNEKKTLASPYYLIKMVHRAARVIKRFLLPPEQSLYTRRFNQFTITETSGTQIPTSGVVTLTPTGEWGYDIYEQTSATNLDEMQSDNIVSLENGIIKVISTPETKNYFDVSDAQKENKYF